MTVPKWFHVIFRRCDLENANTIHLCCNGSVEQTLRDETWLLKPLASSVTVNELS